jgi:hypothetical protein
MKKLIITAYAILSCCLITQAQDTKFNENDFVKYINSLRKTELIKSSDSCSECVNELFSKLENSNMPNSVDVLYHSQKQNKKYGQVFVSIATDGIPSLNQYYEDIIKPLKSCVLNEKNKHFVLFHKQLKDRIIIVFRVIK